MALNTKNGTAPYIYSTAGTSRRSELPSRHATPGARHTMSALNAATSMLRAITA